MNTNAIDTDWHVDIARKVRQLREALGLTQEKVAQDAGPPWTRPYVAKIERGDNQVSTVQARRRLARGLGVEVDRLSAYLEDRLSLADVLPKKQSARSAEVTIEPEDRYPNRAAVLRVLAAELHPETIERARRIALKSADDMAASEWFDDIRALDRQVRRELAHPEHAHEERATKRKEVEDVLDDEDTRASR